MIEVVPTLSADHIARLADAPGLSDEARVRLRVATDGVRHLLAAGGGYAQLDTRDGALELVVDDDATARALVTAAARERDDDVLVWSHADDDAVAHALHALGAGTERILWRLRRPPTPLPPARPFPPDVSVAPFVVGRDEGAWLAVNAAAFADHPEQGRVSLADLQALEAEDWFDADGFLLAWRGDELLGSHWTKAHLDAPGVGEVYVLGVSPAAQGLGLGGALLDAGLAHLAATGRPEIVLYVDDDNPGAVALYEKTGFARDHRDVRYRVTRTAVS